MTALVPPDASTPADDRTPSPAVRDATRLAALRETLLLDTAAEPAFDRVTALVTEALGVPVALVSLVDDARQFFKSAVGLAEPLASARETPLSHSFCQHVVASGEPLVVDDAPHDARVCTNPAIPDLGVMAYLGVPLRTPDGHVLGSLCAVDTMPREWTAREVSIVTRLAETVMSEIALRASARAEARLTAQLQLALEGANDGLWDWNLETGALHLSERWHHMLGYEPGELEAHVRTLERLAHPDDVTAVAPALADHLAGRTPQLHVEHRVRRADGTWAWVLSRGKVVARDAAGRALRAVGTHKDVTQRREAEEALRQQEARLRLIYDGASDLMFLMRVETGAAGAAVYRCESVNEPYLRVTGLAREQLVGHTLEEILPPEAAAHVLPKYAEAVRTGRVLRYDEDVQLPSARVVVETTLTPVHRADGTCTHLLGVARDVTALRLAAERVRESELRLRLVHDNATDCILLMRVEPRADGGRDYRLESANAAWLRTAGRTAEELVGRLLEEVNPAPVAAALRARFETAVEAGAPQRFDRELVTPAGRRVLDATLAPVRDDAGRCTHLLTVARDVTEARRAEALKNQLIGTVSHELRNPLGAIHGALRVVEHDLPGLSGRPRKMLDLAARNTDRSLRLVNDLLDVERLESGAAPLERTVASIAALAGAALDGVRHAADEAGVLVGLEAPDALAALRVHADADRIVQVLVNLVGNAVKFSPVGGRVTVSAEARDGAVTVSVRDQGRGIPAEKLDAIFERFEQVHADDARVKGGAGLGLAICRAIVRQHGGRIWVESAVGRGSTFRFTLPAG